MCESPNRAAGLGRLKAAKESGASDDQLAGPRDFQRKASFLIDFVESENSRGFHADQETARLLNLSLDYSRQGQVALLRGSAAVK